MQTTKKAIFKNIFAILLMIATGSAIVFASFANSYLGSVSGSTDNMIAFVDFSSSSSNGACFDIDGSACANLLSNPGNHYSIDVEVTNQNQQNRSMSYDLHFELVEEAAVKYAIFVYIDDVFYDNLGSILENPANRTQTLGYLRPGNTGNHTLRFEYHIGSNIAYNSQKLSIKIYANYRPVHAAEATLVSAFDDEVNQDGTVVNYGIKRISEATDLNYYANALIVMTNNITLESDLIFKQPISINTNGYTLTIPQNISLVFQGAGVSRLTGSGNINGDGRIILDAEAGVLLSRYSAMTYEIEAFDSNLLNATYTQHLHALIQGGIIAPLNFIDAHYALYNLNAQVSSQDAALFNINQSQGVITPNVSDDSYTTNLIVEAQVNGSNLTVFNDSLTVWGNRSSGYLSAIIQLELAHLLNQPTVSHSLFLPHQFKSVRPSTITWYSSNPAIIDDQGRFSKPISDEMVTLSALIVLHSYIHVVDFDVQTIGMSYTEKVKLVVGGYGDIHFEELNATIDLPTVSNYTTYTNGINLGITNITYTLDTDLYPFLQLPSATQIRIIDYTELEFATVRMNVTFGSAGTFYGVMNISIFLAPPTGVLDYYSIYEYVRSFLPETDVIEDFTLPTFYRAPITYWIPDHISGNGGVQPNDMLTGNEIVNSQEAINIIGSGYAFVDGLVYINTNQVPIEDTIVYVIVEVGTQRRLYSFTISGVLHTNMSYRGGNPANVEIDSPIIFNAILNQLFQNVPLDRNYVVTKALYDTYYRRSTALQVIKATNAQDISSLRGLEYFWFLTDLRISLQTNSDATKNPSTLQNNTFSNVTYIADLTNLTYIEFRHASIITIASWTKLVNVVTLDLRGNTNLMFIQSIEKWQGRLATFDVRGSVHIDPRDEVSIHYYPFSKTNDLYRARYGSGTPTQRWNTSGVTGGSTFTISSILTRWFPNSKLGVDRINGVPDYIYQSLALPNGYYDGFTLNDSLTYWAVDASSQAYIEVVKVGTLTWRANLLVLPVEDVEIILIFNSGTNHWLFGNLSVRRAFFITIKGTGGGS